jgi:hypothetical protein
MLREKDKLEINSNVTQIVFFIFSLFFCFLSLETNAQRFTAYDVAD